MERPSATVVRAFAADLVTRRILGEIRTFSPRIASASGFSLLGFYERRDGKKKKREERGEEGRLLCVPYQTIFCD